MTEIAPITITRELSNKLANMGLVCACLIVTLHVPLVSDGYISRLFTGSGIGNIAVPFFFIASGFFFGGHLGEDGWWVRENRKRLISLLVPYLFWNCFYWIFMHGISWLADKVGIVFGEELSKGLSLGIKPFELPQLSYLWFVRCLIVFVVAGHVFLVFKRKYIGCACLFILFALWIASPHLVGTNNGWYYVFSRVCWLRGLFWFGLGVYLRWNPNRNQLPIVIMRYGKWALVLFVVSLWISLGGVIATVVSLICLWHLIPDSPWPKIITGCSFPIFLLHSAFITLVTGIWRFAGMKGFVHHSALMYLVTVIVVILMSWGASITLMKIPVVGKWVFGGR